MYTEEYAAFMNGYDDGKARCGIYVIGEEFDCAYDYVDEHKNAYKSDKEKVALIKQYKTGYLLGASGEEPVFDIAATT